MLEENWKIEEFNYLQHIEKPRIQKSGEANKGLIVSKLTEENTKREEVY